MRTFSPIVTGALSKKHGLDPTLFIGVQWDGTGTEYYYSSHPFEGAKQQIISASGLETTQVVTGTGTSQSVTVTLTDTDGSIRNILDSFDVHKKPAKVYLGFPGVPIDQSVVLIDGEINSEMKWDDRARTFEFTILNKIEGRLFGFAMEDGLFAKVNEQDRAKAWPFRFGVTCAYPAVEVRNGVKGLLRIGQGVLDATLDAKICQARQIRCPWIPDPLYAPLDSQVADSGFFNPSYASAKYKNNLDPYGQHELGTGSGGDQKFGATTPYGGRPVLGGNAPADLSDEGILGGKLAMDPSNNQPLVPDKECQRAKFETLCQLLQDRANQLLYVNDTLSILGGGEFPQGRLVKIRIDDVIYTGVFSGETFSIEKTNRLDTPPATVDCTNFTPPTKGYRNKNANLPGSIAECNNPTSEVELRVVGGAGEAWRILGEMEDSEFKWLPSGSDVFLQEDDRRVHVASLVPGLVTGVYAYRKFGDTSQMTELPGTYYEIVQTDYGDLESVEIHLLRGLESYKDENWENKIYVSFDSDIGPSTADVIQWIIENFTEYAVDAASFAAVKASLTNYPCNYYHAKRESVLTTVNRLAYEARCALTITDNVVKIKYLPLEPDADKVLTQADIVAGSFSFSHTGTESLVTSSDVTWQPAGADILSIREIKRRLTVERNVNKYGHFGRSHTYESITNETQVLKTATFWSIRDSNTWRVVKFQTTLENMDLELFDCVQLNIPQFPNVKTIVTSAKVEPSTGIVEVECWTPVLSGTTAGYFFAWPATKPQEPYPGDNYEVDAPALNITPPVGHPLYVESDNGEPLVVPTTGDRVPSDLDDVFPSQTCQDMNDAELVDIIAPQFDRASVPVNTAQQATNADAKTAEGMSFNSEQPEEIVACGKPTMDSCVWTVNVQFGTAHSVGASDNPGGGFNCGLKPQPCNQTQRGKRCSGQSYFVCKTFGSETIARAYHGVMLSQIELAHCSFRSGVTAPVSSTLMPIKSSACENIDMEIGSSVGPTFFEEQEDLLPDFPEQEPDPE